MLLDEEVSTKLMEKGDTARNIKGVTIGDNPEPGLFRPYQYIYGRYETEKDEEQHRSGVPEELYWRPKGTNGDVNHPFRESVRLKLTRLMVEQVPVDKDIKQLNIEKLIERKVVKAVFPLHNVKTKELLEKEWLPPLNQIDRAPWFIPTTKIKEHYGEKIGLYFTFIGHYAQWLAYPAFTSIPFSIILWAISENGDIYESNAKYALPFASIYITLWAIGMLEYWKRLESYTAMKWGTSEFEVHEVERVSFVGTELYSHIDGEKRVFFPTAQRTRRQHFTTTIVLICMGLALGVVAGLYAAQDSIARHTTPDDAQLIVSILNAFQIQFFTLVYNNFIAYKLNSYENHRTATNFEDAMITKLFAFQFVNSYASFFYLGFVAPYQLPQEGADPTFRGRCTASNCMEPLGINLAVIMASRIAQSFFFNKLLPLYFANQRAKHEEDESTRPAIELQLRQNDVLRQSLADYSDTAIQFGYIAMFISAFPFVACFGLALVIVDLRAKAWRLLHSDQRPLLQLAQDIGTWQTIFEVVAYAAVVTNAGLVVFTQNTFKGYFDSYGQTMTFIIFQWVLIVGQQVMRAVIPDIPINVSTQLERSTFIVGKLIDKKADDDDDKLMDDKALRKVKEQFLASVLVDEFPMNEAQGDAILHRLEERKSNKPVIHRAVSHR